MKQLNLVPLSIRAKAQARQTAPYIVIAVLISAGLVGAAWMGFSWQIKGQQEEKERLILEEAKRQELAAQTAKELNVDNDITTRVKELNTLAKSDVDWARVFSAVTSLIPKDITLSGYTFATSGGAMTLKITGTAPSNASYAVFSKFLEQKKADKAIVDFVQDGYAYQPSTGAVTMSITITIPNTSVTYPTL